jgi:hypothetical protein
MIAASSPCTIACEIEKTTPQIKTTKAVRGKQWNPLIFFGFLTIEF